MATVTAPTKNPRRDEDGLTVCGADVLNALGEVERLVDALINLGGCFHDEDQEWAVRWAIYERLALRLPQIAEDVKHLDATVGGPA